MNEKSKTDEEITLLYTKFVSGQISGEEFRKKMNEKNTEVLIEPFDYCTKCGLVYGFIQNYECVVCHGKLKPIKGLLIPDRVVLKKEEK